MTHNTNTAALPITLTSSAAIELKRIMNETDLTATPYLRVGVKGGGCSGMSYVLGFDKAESDDNVYQFDGIPMIIKKAHLLYLQNMQIDFSNGLDARGFVFENPNASSSCGCGSSFAV